MGQICTVCDHPQNDEIDFRLRAGEPGRSVARAFGLSEAAARRHRDGHLPNTSENITMNMSEEIPEMDHSVPTRPADTPDDPEPQEDARSAAVRLLEAEEEEQRSQRLAELERQERDRREREEAARELEGRQRALREQADELGQRRRELEEAAEEEMGRLLRVLAELAAVDRQHTRVLSLGGRLPSGTLLLSTTLQRWTSVRLGDFSPGATFDGHGGTLAEMDRLTPDAREHEGAPPAA